MTATLKKPGTLVLRCHVCKKPVTGTTGYVCVDKQAAYERRQLVEDWKAANPGPVISGQALLAYPDAAPWHVYHRRCDPRPDSDSDYWFDCSRVGTERDLLGWTAHLLGKTWLPDTAWDQFLYSVLTANGWRS